MRYHIVPGKNYGGLMVLNIMKSFITYYPSSGALSYLYNFGFLAFVILFLQILTGTFLSTYVKSAPFPHT